MSPWDRRDRTEAFEGPSGPSCMLKGGKGRRMNRLQKLADLGAGTVYFSEPLRRHSSWRIGGPADALVEPSSREQILRLASFVRREGIPLVVIGRGTNLLFSDSGIRGVVLKLGRCFSKVTVEDSTVSAEGGIWVPRLVRNLADRGLSGLEHAAGIPGSLGGLVAMNGGSLRRSVGENILSVHAVSLAGACRDFSREECGFSYRRSLFQNFTGVPGVGDPSNMWIVTEVKLVLEGQTPSSVRKECLRILAERRGKFPLKLPNCGSVFTNDPGIYELAGPPGRVVEETGLKGARIGDAEVSRIHANFIVNLGNATAEDVLRLIGEVRRRVRNRIGRWMECEVRYVAEDGTMMPASKACPGGE